MTYQPPTSHLSYLLYVPGNLWKLSSSSTQYVYAVLHSYIAKLKSIFMPFTVLLICWLYIKYSMWSSNTLVNPSFIILKITSPRKTLDTTTVFDGGTVAFWKPVQHGRAASAASHFKVKGADGPLYSPRLFERVDLRPHHPHPWSSPTVRAFKCSTLEPSRHALGFKVWNAYQLPNSLAEHLRYSRLLQGAILDCNFIMLTTCCAYLHFKKKLRSCRSSRPKYRGIIVIINPAKFLS